MGLALFRQDEPGAGLRRLGAGLDRLGLIRLGLGLDLFRAGLDRFGTGLVRVLLGFGLVLLGLGLNRLDEVGLERSNGGAEDSLRHMGDGLGRRGVSSPCNCHACCMLSGLPGELLANTGECRPSKFV